MRKFLSILLALALTGVVQADYSTSRTSSVTATSVGSAAFPLRAATTVCAEGSYGFTANAGGLCYATNTTMLLHETGSIKLSLDDFGFELTGGNNPSPGTSIVRAGTNTTANGAGGTLSLEGGNGAATNGAGGQASLIGGTGQGNADGGVLFLAGGTPAGTGRRGQISIAGWPSNTTTESRLFSDYTNATTTFSVLGLDPGEVVVNGRPYYFRTVYFVDNATDANGAKFDFNGGTAAMTSFRAHCTLSDTAAPAAAPAQVTALATTIAFATVTGSGMIECRGAFVPSSAGTFRPRAASNGGATTLTVFVNSHVIYGQFGF